MVILLPLIITHESILDIDKLLCWTQGLSLNIGWVMQQAIGFIMALHMWLLIVKGSAGAERFRKYYVMLIFGIPLLAIVTAITAAILTRTQTLEAGMPFGIVPRNAYCFWCYPYPIRVAGYVGWYALLSIPGAILSCWVAIFLIRYKLKQRKQQQQTVTATQSNNTAGYNNMANMLNSNTSAGGGVGMSTLYRTVIFACLYTLTTSMSFIPSMIAIIRYWSTGVDMTELKQLKFTEFASAAVGMGAFFVFGTGEHGYCWFKSRFSPSVEGTETSTERRDEADSWQAVN